jgi:segregation and condensation protein B
MSNAAAADYAKLLEGAEAGVAVRDVERTPPPLMRIIEALLFASDQPLNAASAAVAVRGLTSEQFRAAIDDLNRMYRRQDRPYAIQSRSEGHTLALKAAFTGMRGRLTGSPREARLTVPMLDVLAVVAYKQPVTRNEIDALRGADSAATLRQLVRLSLVAVQDAVPGTTEPAYNTTPRFLELFGLRSLDDLPQTADLQKI